MAKGSRGGKRAKGGNSLLPAVISNQQKQKAGELGLGGKGSPREIIDALDTVNRKNFYSGDIGYRINCQRCVWAYEAQRRGYKVEALPNNDNLGANNRWMSIVDGKMDGGFVNFILDDKATNKTTAKAIQSQMSQWGEGSRGIIAIARRKGSGHVFNVEYRNGKVLAVDAQIGDTYGNEKNSMYKALTQNKAMPTLTRLYRTDNVKFNEKEATKYFRTIGD